MKPYYLSLILLLFSLSFANCGSNQATSAADYRILDAGREFSIVLLNKDVTPHQMDIIADSLYRVSEHKKLNSYHVMFYFREDYKGHVCYADKLWYWNKNMEIVKRELEVTGIKSSDP